MSCSRNRGKQGNAWGIPQFRFLQKAELSVHASIGIVSVVFTQWTAPFFRFFADAGSGRQIDDFKQIFFDFMVTGFADAHMRYRLFFREFPEQ